MIRCFTVLSQLKLFEVRQCSPMLSNPRFKGRHCNGIKLGVTPCSVFAYVRIKQINTLKEDIMGLSLG